MSETSLSTSPAPRWGDRFFDTTRIQELVQAVREGVPSGPEGVRSRPWTWAIQPLDVLVFGLFHFWLGAIVGWAIDTRLLGPLTADQKRAGPARRIGYIVAQMVLVVLAFNYLRKGLLLLQPRWGVRRYSHAPVPAMDGGFAMSLGFAWSQRNLVQRFHDLLDTWPKGGEPVLG